MLGAVPVRLEVLNNKDRVMNVQANPSVVHVETEPLQKKEFPLKVEIQGEAASGYEVNGYTTDCDSIWAVSYTHLDVYKRQNQNLGSYFSL